MINARIKVLDIKLYKVGEPFILAGLFDVFYHVLRELKVNDGFKMACQEITQSPESYPIPDCGNRNFSSPDFS